jgi:hypothetical protein
MHEFNVLVGEWTTEATHPAFPGTVVRGHVTFEWLDGEKFLIQRAGNDHPDFPDSISVIGEVDGRIAMHYFDSRGVQRVYEMGLTEGVWKISRDEPGFSQRCSGTFEDDGSRGTTRRGTTTSRSRIGDAASRRRRRRRTRRSTCR